MRYATKTTAECEAALGPRGHFHTTKDNRWTVRNWLTAQGLKSDFVNRLTYAELAGAYNDVSNTNLERLRSRAENGVFGDAPLGDQLPKQPQPLPHVIAAYPQPVAADLPFVAQPQPVKANGKDVDVNTVAEMLTRLLGQQNQTLDVDAVRKIVHEEVQGLAPRPVEVLVNDGPAVLIQERVNPVFDRVLKEVAKGQNVLLVGPAGCGKSHLCEQIARALKAEFGVIHGTAGASESALTGWLLPSDGGKFEYVPSRFVELYEKGESLFCFDEYDAFDPNMMMVANGALSNGHLHIAHRRNMPATKRGENVYLMGTANTFGTGANPLYTARNAMDGASNDRWLYIVMDYDRDLEADIARAGGLTPTETSDLWNLRDKVRETGLRRIISTRAFQKAAIMKSNGTDWKTIKATLVEGWSKDERAKVGMAVPS